MLTCRLVASIVWLENNVFLAAYNTTGGPQTSIYHLITRHVKPALSFVFQKLSDPAENFGEKTPHLSILRLRDFPPDLQDLLLVSSSAAESIGLLTRSKTPLTSGAPVEVFTTTELADDSKRANLPLGGDFNETYPIGAALDLSSKDKVHKPIPTDEMDESPGPLPGLWVLNNEGVLSSWWVVYNESIRQGTTYPGLLASGEGVALAAAATPKATPFGTPSAPTPGFGGASAATPKSMAFGTPSVPTSAFGGASALGASQSPWGAAAPSSATPSAGATFGSSTFGSAAAAGGPKFGAPAFGSSSFGTPQASGFGQSSTMGVGMRTSPWATAGSAPGSTSAFGKSSFGSIATPAVNPFAGKGEATANPFGSGKASSPASGGGFAGFASKGGFASAVSGTQGGGAFGSGASPGSFGSFGSTAQGGPTSTETAFPPAKTTTTSAFGGSPFVLGTTFKADAASAADNEKPRSDGSSMFGSGFGLSLGQPAAVNESKDEDMDAVTPAAVEFAKARPMFESTTPTTTPAPSKFFSAPSDVPAQKGGLFGATASQKPLVAAFAARDEAATKPAPDETHQELPLPPDTTSKTEFLLGSSSSSSGSAPSPAATTKAAPNKTVDDAPLPPDPWALPKSKKSQQEDAPLPPLPGVPTKAKARSPEPAPLPPDPWSKPELTAIAPTDLPLPSLPVAASKGAPTTKTALIPSVFDAPLKAGHSGGSAPNPFANMKAPSADTTPEGSDLSGDDGDNDDEVDDDEGVVEEEEEEEEEEEGVDEGEEDDNEAEGDYDEEQEEGEVPEADEAEDHDDAGSEGSGIDVAGDLSPTTTTGFAQTPGFTPQSSFAGMAGSHFSLASSRPEERQLFGEGRRAPQFPQPTQASPQSPSPTRKNPLKSVPYQVLRSESSRSVSAPGYASQILGSKSAGPGISRPTSGRTPLARDANVEQQRKAVARQEADEARVLVDDQFEAIERQLDAPVEPTLQLPECTWLVGTEVQGGSSIASQNEAVYRDINRMIQTLKANARNLNAYIAGHMGQGRASPPPKAKDDLESIDEWLLCDTDACGDVLTYQLKDELDSARVEEGDEAKRACAELLKEAARLRALRDDVQRVFASQADPDQIATTKALPLSAEQAAQQKDLRRAFTSVSNRVAEVERDLTQLKAKMVSLGGTAGKGGTSAAPTVDAVVRTITRMTTMVEKRSGDVDVLENQMRRLGINGGAALASRDGSPFTPPANKRASIFSPGSTQRSLASSVGSVGGARATPPRKKLSGYSEQEKAAARLRVDGRQRTLQGLKAALEQKGPIYMAMDEE